MIHWKAALCAAALLYSTQATAANRLFVFHTTGTGFQYAKPGASDPYQRFELIDLLFTVSLGDQQPLFTVPGVSQGFGGSDVSLGATATGVGASTRYNYISGSFDACFDNPSALLPGAATEYVSTCTGNAVFRAQGSEFGYVEYNGLVTKLQVLPEASPSQTSFRGFTLAVPEPATWALMLAGFAMTGYALRRRRAHVAIA